MGAKQTGKSLITKEGAVLDPPGSITHPQGCTSQTGPGYQLFHPLVVYTCSSAAFGLPELPRHRFTQRVLAFSPAQAGCYQDFPPPAKEITLFVAGGRPLGVALKPSGAQLVAEDAIRYFSCPFGESETSFTLLGE